eukprot:Nitzschia sp. Nitz4//scaffold15_size197535//46383//46892//NITZ4_001563-RA/size197535-processed-gene-0.60-mRNA-1//-1//CDS//3329537670//4806//frame0
MSPITDNLETPDEYICPISLGVMKDPVMSRDGKNYEKRAILQWLNRGNGHCPLTRQPLKASLLVPNTTLKRSIEKWMLDQGVSSDGDESVCSDSDEGFVGILHVDDDSSFGSETPPAASSVTTDGTESGSDEDDELKDLLDLYNEVLDLIGPGRGRPVEIRSPELTDSL